MPEITKLREKSGRVRVFVDGEFYAEIDAGVSEDYGLVEGFDISDEELGKVCREGEYSLAMRRAFNLLSYRERSEGEIRDRLTTKHGHSPEVVDAVIVRLGELGYLDDEEFARSAARKKAEKYGPRRVIMDLQRSGISKEVAEEAVSEEFGGRDQLSEAREAADTRYNRDGVGDGDALARKVYGFLARRGYTSEVCIAIAGEYRERRTGSDEDEL